MRLSPKQTIIAHLVAAFGVAVPAWSQAVPATSQTTSSIDTSTQAPAVIPAPAGWILTYDDEFSGTKVDPTIWNVGNSIGVGGGLSYCSPDDVSVQDGYLRLLAEKRTDKTYAYTSGQVDTFDTWPFLYGRVELRARMPAGSGAWVNEGLLSVSGAGWPGIGIPEYFGNKPGAVQFASFWSAADEQTDTNYGPPGFDASKWHVYAVEWQPGSLRFYVDSILCGTQTDHVPAEPMAVGIQLGVSPFAGDPSAGTWPQEEDVDYIRIYRAQGQPPPVYAGGDQQVQVEGSIDLVGHTCNPVGGVKTLWAKQSGPGPVTFDDSGALTTKAHFTKPGQYTLDLTASDKDESASDSITVLVDSTSATYVSPTADTTIEYGSANNSPYSIANPPRSHFRLLLEDYAPPDMPSTVDWAMIQFNIAGIPQTGSVALRLFGGLNLATVAYPSPIIVDAMDPDTDFNPDHWTVRPTFGPQIATFPVKPHLHDNQARYYEADITSYVRAQQKAGKTSITLALFTTVPSPTELRCVFQSSRGASNHPQLVVQPGL